MGHSTLPNNTGTLYYTVAWGDANTICPHKLRTIVAWGDAFLSRLLHGDAICSLGSKPLNTSTTRGRFVAWGQPLYILRRMNNMFNIMGTMCSLGSS